MAAVDELIKIPTFMRAKGWSCGAALKERWFSLPPNSSPAAGREDTSTIKLDSWALTFSRAKTAYDELLASKLWVNDKARTLLATRLGSMRMVPGHRLSFGDLSQAAKQIETDYLTFAVVGGAMDPLDDMYGALGKFTYRVAVQGTAVPVDKKAQHSVRIESIGIYIRDTYDFNGDQPLGFWNFKTGAVSRTPGFGYDYIENKTFREGRAKNSRGGDFLIFSEVKVLKRTPPDVFVVDG
jgi:hypothetical protein